MKYLNEAAEFYFIYFHKTPPPFLVFYIYYNSSLNLEDNLKKKGVVKFVFFNWVMQKYTHISNKRERRYLRISVNYT